VNRNFRLTQSTDFKRVRRFGKSYAHPLVVLVVLVGADEQKHIGVMAGRSVGNAVQRNRAKRMLREAVRTILPRLKLGWNVVLIARNPILNAKLSEIEDCLIQLFSKANLISDYDER
jgi:ribonuclease P protein component